jgi:signal transduction histidine kinase
LGLAAYSSWREGRPLILLFAATIVLPSLILGLLAYRALDADRQLAEQAQRDSLQAAARRAHADLERQILSARARAEQLARGLPLTTANNDLPAALLTPILQPSPSSAFAWIPDGHTPAPAPLPPELEQAQERELRESNGNPIAAVYESLLKRAPRLWHGWLHLRLAQVHARNGRLADSHAALRLASVSPESPGPIPTRFAARFELTANSPDIAVTLYRDLSSGRWLLEKSSYAFYESRLRELAGTRLPPSLLIAEQQRQSLARLLERAIAGESGWLTEGSFSALVHLASHSRRAAVFTLDTQLDQWLQRINHDASPAIAIRKGASSSPAALSLASLGLPGSLWAEPLNPSAAQAASGSRRRLMLAILLLVVGTLLFGTIAMVRLVRRELHVARMQTDFVATVSHEFRSPLTGIRQLAEMLLAGRASQDEQRRRHYYDLICQESGRLTRLVENVLDFSRLEDGRRQTHFAPIETSGWLRSLAASLQERRPITLSLAGPLPPILADREALSSAVLNLLDNAIKYSPHPSPVELRACATGGWVTISIRDAGCGIAPHEQSRIFDKFYRVSNAAPGAPNETAKGVGLGLALVKRIADAHGARLAVESAPGQGSTFSISLKAVS